MTHRGHQIKRGVHMRRRNRIRRPNRRPPYLQQAIAEGLEERQMLTLTVDVRAADGSKSIELSNIGQVVNLQVWAEITDPQNQPTEDGLQDLAGSFLGTNVGPGPVAGNLAATLVSPFNYIASQNGTVQDLNGDGNLDVGSNNNSSVTNFFYARSQFLETSSSGTIVGNALEFEIGTLTYTVTHLNYGGETDINFRPRGPAADTIAAVWQEDGQGLNDTTGTFTAGAPFVVTAPPAKLVFTTQPVSTTIGTTIDAPNGVAVAVEDASGNIIASSADNISLSLSPNSPALTGTTTAQASSGIASFNTLSISTSAANYTLTATDASASLSGTSQPFNVNPSSPYNFQSLASMNANASLTGGFIPLDSVYIDNNGNIFGTTTYGGPSGDGAVFEIAEPSGVYSTLVSFTGNSGAFPGNDPVAGLISDGNGNLFGTTSSGGTSNDGTVFELSGPGHTFSSILSFTGTSGASPGATPQASLTSDGDGNLFGTTSSGGTSNDGTVFELAGLSHTFSSLFSFTGTSGAYPGFSPQGNLTSDGNGNLLGTTAEGGSSNYGTVFELAGSSHTFSLVHTFAYGDGAYPLSGLTSDGNGNLFGTTERGGSSVDGTVFELAGTSHTFSSIISFDGSSLGPYPGYGPVTALTSDGNGNLFATTTAGNEGLVTPAVFELAGTSHTFSTVYSFNGETGSGFQVSLTSDSNGNLFGTDNYGGSFDFGSVFELPASSRSTPTTLYSFSGGMGWNPIGSVVIDSSGNVLGVTTYGGAYGDGTIFEIAEPSGVYSTLFSFTGDSGPYPGDDPQTGLVSDGNGNLIGMTPGGGSSGDGTAFELAGPSHAFSSLLSFTGNSGTHPGANPEVSLTPDGNGNLFGTTVSGGTSGDGTVFELAGPSHTFSSLVSFTGYTGLAPGNQPQTPLTSDGKGNLFGTTLSGGTSGDGTVFELAGPSYTFSSLVSFTGNTGAFPGTIPLASLVSDGDGNLIGTTDGGGTSGDGTVFELAGLGYTFTSLFSFTGTSGAYLGANPVVGLTSDGNGNLLGMTQGGGTSNVGTVFELADPNHTFSSLFSFGIGTGPYLGVNPNHPLISDGRGNLFGSTAGIGGSVFELAGASHTYSVLFLWTGTGGLYPGVDANALTPDGHGDLFATSELGGAADDGTAFEIALSSNLAFAGSPSGASASATLSPIQVNVEQGTGSIADGDSSIVTLSIQSGPTGATLGGTTSVQAVNGVATFNNLALNIAGTYTLIATDGSLTPATSNSFVIQPAGVSWTGAADGLNWSNPGNWSNDLVPAADTDVTIGSGFTVQVGSGSYSVESMTASSPIEIANGATLLLFGPSTFASSLTVDDGGTLKVAADPVLLVVNGSTFIDNGTIDLGDSDMIIHDGNLAQTTSLIATGFNAGLWNGPGVTSSAAAATNNMALGVELNDDGTPAHNPLMTTFDGQTVTNTDVLVKYTYFGDTNLDGVVNATDYIAIDNGFNSQSGSNPLTGWNNGDFNYDGVINGDDYSLIDNAFNTQNVVTPAAVAQPQAIVSQPPTKPRLAAVNVFNSTSQAVAYPPIDQSIWNLDFNPTDKRKPSLAKEIFAD